MPALSCLYASPLRRVEDFGAKNTTYDVRSMITSSQKKGGGGGGKSNDQPRGRLAVEARKLDQSNELWGNMRY